MTTTSPLHVGLTLPVMGPGPHLPGPDRIAEVAALAEDAGFDSVWVGDHLEHPWAYHDCLVTLGFVAARTTRIRLGSLVLQLPLRQLAVVAKQVASLAILSGGRLILGVGVGGDVPAEWEAAGVDRSQRGARMDEAVPLLRRLIAGETVDERGRFTSLPGFTLRPPSPPVPLWFGGGRPGMRRAARDGDAWVGARLSLDDFAACSAELVDELDRHGRPRDACPAGMMLPVYIDDRDDGSDLRGAQVLAGHIHPGAPDALVQMLRPFVLAGTPAGIAKRVAEWQAAGCSSLVITTTEQGPAQDEQLRAIADEVLPLLR